MLEVSALDVFKEGNTNKRCAAGTRPGPCPALTVSPLVTGEAPLRAPAGASTHSSSILPTEGGAAHSTLKLQVFAVKRIPLVLSFFFLKLTSPNLKSKVNIALVPGQLLR